MLVNCDKEDASTCESEQMATVTYSYIKLKNGINRANWSWCNWENHPKYKWYETNDMLQWH